MGDNRKITEKRNRSYRGREITVYWKPSACIHASSCYRELIEVFNPSRRPWVDMEGAPEERIIETVNLCPTEALTWKWNEEERNSDVDRAHTNHIKWRRPELYSQSGEDEDASSLTVRVLDEGPVMVEGSFSLICGGKSTIMKNTITSFCRCGQSKSQPYCDGEHRNIRFPEGETP